MFWLQQEELDRRRPGQSRITIFINDSETCEIYSGVSEGITLGTPICIMVPNTDQKSHDYSEMSVAYRPSHADATYDMKYGIRAVRTSQFAFSTFEHSSRQLPFAAKIL